MPEMTAEYLDRLRRAYVKPCVYCGDPASTRDHVPPRSMSKLGKTVRACWQCNCQILRGLPIVELNQRARYVRAWLHKQPQTPQIKARIKWASTVAIGLGN